MVKLTPWPSTLSTSMKPPWAVTISRQTASPKPVPPWQAGSGDCLVLKNGSKIRRIFSALIPAPLSAIVTLTQPVRLSWSAEILIVPPLSAIAWQLLISILSRTWISSTRFPYTAKSSGHLQRMEMDLLSNRPARLLVASLIMSLTGTISFGPVCRRERPKSPRQISAARSALAETCRKAWPTSSGFCPDFRPC